MLLIFVEIPDFGRQFQISKFCGKSVLDEAFPDLVLEIPDLGIPDLAVEIPE